MRLAEVFSTALSDVVAPPPALDAQLAAHWATARAAWPQLPDDPHGFVRHLAACCARGASLEHLRAADLYLALHCASGSPPAIEQFLAGPFTAARATLHKLGCPAHLIDDVEQQLRATLLVGSAKIAGYAGRGDLRSWIASIAARMAGKQMYGDHRPVDSPDALAAIATDDADPELAYLRAAYLDGFATAVQDALAVLTPRERNLLRQHHLDRLTLDELATLHAVHRATVARWLASARDRIIERTRELICERLLIAPDELDSVARLVRSQVHVSLARLLA